MRHVSAWRGELGLRVYSHAPQVYALCQQEPCRVEIEEGDQALYPAAKEWKVVDRADDDTRHGGPPRVHPEKEWFTPEPHVPQGIDGVDVVVCPRKRAYGSFKNWSYWPRMTEEIQLAGFSVFAAGAPDSSYEVDCPKAWDRERFLDASIEAIREANLVVATDAGLAHLAVVCGTDLLLIHHKGLVAPGPVVNAAGDVLEESYWPVKVERYREENHTGSQIDLIDGWGRPKAVLRAISDGLYGRGAA